MSYKEAQELNEGDNVTIIETKEQKTVESVRGTLMTMFILLDNGRTYRHDEIQKIKS